MDWQCSPFPSGPGGRKAVDNRSGRFTFSRTVHAEARGHVPRSHGGATAHWKGRTMNVAGYVIHLERAEARRANVQEIVDSCPAPASVQCAVDGRRLSSDEIASFCRRRIHDPRYPFELRNGEVATFMSHRACWRRMLDERLDAALVMEDDIRVGGGKFADALAFALKHVESLG